jgi:hypothetical protein
MNEVLLFAFMIAHNESRQDPAKQTTAVCPIVDSRHKETKRENSNGPTTNLPINHLAVISSTALPEVERRADKAANGG